MFSQNFKCKIFYINFLRLIWLTENILLLIKYFTAKKNTIKLENIFLKIFYIETNRAYIRNIDTKFSNTLITLTDYPKMKTKNKKKKTKEKRCT